MSDASAICRPLLLLIALMCGACAEAVDEGRQGVCDDLRPCAFGAICVAGFCAPPPPDAQRLDSATDLAVDAAPDPEPPIDMTPADGAPPPADAAPPRDAQPMGDGGPITDGAPGDAGPMPDVGPMPDQGLPDDCGRFGEACCPGDVCRSGACLEGTCAIFGGVYAFGGRDGTCTARNPLARNRCGCPSGFVDHPLEDVDFDESDGLGIFHSVYVCTPGMDDPTADLRGAFAEAFDPDDAGCPSGCRLGPLQPACGCPEQTAPMSFDGVLQRPGLGACAKRLTFCAGNQQVTFGGAYRVFRPETVACQEIVGPALCVANPRTGACSCPAGYDGIEVGMMAEHPGRGAPFYCRADLVVCARTPE